MRRPQEAGRTLRTASRGMTERQQPQLKMPERCPTCGFPVENFFDHVDRDGIDPKTGICK